MMKYSLLTLLGVFALGSTSLVMAQDYDDIYYDGASSSNGGTAKSKVVNTATSGAVQLQRHAASTAQPRRYKVTVESNPTVRDEDEYNRRGAYSEQGYAPDTATYYDNSQNSFSNTERIQRFYNPDVVDGSGDDELITLYYDTAPTINLVIGSSWGPSWGWGISTWYDPWYSSWYNTWYGPWYGGWYDPFYYSAWYGWSRPWGWYSGWYDPWFYAGWSAGWCWHNYGWGWSYPYWDGYYWSGGRGSRWAGGRRPQGQGVYNGGTSGGRRPGYATVNASRRPNVGKAVSRDMISSQGKAISRENVNLTGTHRRPGYSSGNSLGNTPGSVSTSRRYNGNLGNVETLNRRPATVINSRTSLDNNSHRSSTVRNSNRIYTEPTRNYTQPSRNYSQPSRNYSSPSPSRGFGGGSRGGGGGFSGGGRHRR